MDAKTDRCKINTEIDSDAKIDDEICCEIRTRRISDDQFATLSICCLINNLQCASGVRPNGATS